MGPALADLTAQHKGAPLGQRISVSGQVLDEGGRPVANTMVEIWQANSAGRYSHAKDQWDAPLDPNFTGAGRVVTDSEGRYRFVTIRPGAYPWGNHPNAWRPAHIHLSLLGPAFATRLVTQFYFQDDPLITIDPIACAVPAGARDRLVARFDLATTEPHWALGYVFDIVLRGREATPFED
jgi:protocatechuate 3,4-dioxygenase beta subunit